MELTLSLDRKGFLSQEEIIDNIREERTKIPEDVDRSIADFANITNVVSARRLLQAVSVFSDPQEGFALWKSYYRSGDDVALKAAFSGHRFSLLASAKQIWWGFKDVDKLNGKPEGFCRVAKRSLAVFFELAARTLLVRRINHMETNAYALMTAFQKARRLVCLPDKESEPLYDVLHEPLKDAFETRLTTSLEALEAASDQPLLSQDLLSQRRAAVLEKTLHRFDLLAQQSFCPAVANERDSLDLERVDGLIPEGQKFGIECEGFWPAALPFARQVSKTFLLLRQLKPFGVRVAFPIKSLTPKTDDKYEKWSITRDTSVINPLRFVLRHEESRSAESMNNHGLEIVSPILEGAGGWLQAVVVLKTLNSLGFKSNQTCGFHVHVDMETASFEEVKNVAKAFIRNERQIDRLIDFDRREDKVGFAKSVAQVKIEDVDSAKDLQELVAIMNAGDRNSKIDMTNLVSPHAPPTIQYRAEGGPHYMKSAASYTGLMVNFTYQARTNPDITIQDIMATFRVAPSAPAGESRPSQQDAVPSVA